MSEFDFISFFMQLFWLPLYLFGFYTSLFWKDIIQKFFGVNVNSLLGQMGELIRLLVFFLGLFVAWVAFWCGSGCAIGQTFNFYIAGNYYGCLAILLAWVGVIRGIYKRFIEGKN